MPKVAPIELDDSQKDKLKSIFKKGKDWRERDRAETILLLAAGWSTSDIAEHQGVCREAVRVRRRKWMKTGFESLVDRPRSGAPSKLSSSHRQQLTNWLESEPLTVRQLLARLKAEFQLTISANTLRNEIKRLGYVWKRTRYCLRTNGSPTLAHKSDSTTTS